MVQFCCHSSPECTAAIILRCQGLKIDIMRHRGGMRRHSSSHLDRGFIALDPRGWAEGDSADQHLSHESCHEWIEQNWTWSIWLSCLAADEGCNGLLWAIGRHFFHCAGNLFTSIEHQWKIKDYILRHGYFMVPSLVSDCFFTFRRNSPSPGGGCDSQGQLQPGNSGRRLPTSWQISDITSHGHCRHCSVMSPQEGQCSSKNQTWLTNVEENPYQFDLESWTK